MSLSALLIALGANVVGVTPAQSERPSFLELAPSILAAERSVISPQTVSSLPPQAAGERSDVPVISYPEASTRPDLAVYLGNRRSGPQLELGALGGGRADAPSLVHVGFGFDF
jgi:hypothetical protein